MIHLKRKLPNACNYTLNNTRTACIRYLSGWATYGKLACSVYQIGTHYRKLKNGRKCSFMGHKKFLHLNHPWRRNKISFSNSQELQSHPVRLSEHAMLHQLECLDDIPFGKTQRTRKIGVEYVIGNWKKRSNFFNCRIGKTY